MRKSLDYTMLAHKLQRSFKVLLLQFKWAQLKKILMKQLLFILLTLKNSYYLELLENASENKLNIFNVNSE